MATASEIFEAQDELQQAIDRISFGVQEYLEFSEDDILDNPEKYTAELIRLRSTIEKVNDLKKILDELIKQHGEHSGN